MPRNDSVTGDPGTDILHSEPPADSLNGRTPALTLRYAGTEPRSAKANSILYNSHRVADYANRTGPPPIVRRWDRRTPKEGKGPTRGAREDGRMHVAAAIAFGRKSRLKELMACPCPCPGSAVAPLLR
jgi:hypothetical protein